jgi:hypothetical protein
MNTAPDAGVLHTSVFIATESRQQLDESLIPAVLAATSSDTRAQRLATLESVADMETLPVD